MLEKAFSNANHFIGALATSPSDTLSKVWKGIYADTSPDLSGHVTATALGIGTLLAVKLAPVTCGASLVAISSVADRYLKVGEKLAEQDNAPPPPTPAP